MKRIFGARKPTAPPPTLEEAADKLTGRGDKLDEQINKLDQQLAKFRDQIKRTRPGPAQEGLKRRALAVLKQKRLYENQRDTLYNQQYNMEQTRFTVESMKETVTTVQAMKVASKEMKTAFKKNKELNIDYIDNLQDDMADMMDMANEINEVLGRSYDVPDDIDEADLMAELEGLEEDLTLETEVGVPSYLQEPDLPDLPAAPQPEHHAEDLGPMALPQRT